MTNIELLLWRRSSGFHQKLVSVYTSLIKKSGGGYLFIPLADALACIGQVDQAITILKKGLVNHPNSRAAMILLAQLLYDKGDIEMSKRILIKVVSRWPDVTAGVSLLCRIYERDGNFSQAGRIAYRLLDYYPDLDFVKKLTARYRKLDKPAKAPTVANEMTIAVSRSMALGAIGKNGVTQLSKSAEAELRARKEKALREKMEAGIRVQRKEAIQAKRAAIAKAQKKKELAMKKEAAIERRKEVAARKLKDDTTKNVKQKVGARKRARKKIENQRQTTLSQVKIETSSTTEVSVSVPEQKLTPPPAPTNAPDQNIPEPLAPAIVVLEKNKDRQLTVDQFENMLLRIETIKQELAIR